jgi:hypothetical protein
MYSQNQNNKLTAGDVLVKAFGVERGDLGSRRPRRGEPGPV